LRMKKTDLAYALIAKGGYAMKPVCEALEVARSNIAERLQGRKQKRGCYRIPTDARILPIILHLVDDRPTYGYRRVHALLNRKFAAEGQPPINHKRVYRIMKQNGLLLARLREKRERGLMMERLLPWKAIFVGVPMFLKSHAGMVISCASLSAWTVVIGKL
jgi:hypothetical protein